MQDIRGIREAMEEYLGKRATKGLFLFGTIWVVLIMLLILVNKLTPFFQLFETARQVIEVALSLISLVLLGFAFYYLFAGKRALREAEEILDDTEKR